MATTVAHLQPCSQEPVAPHRAAGSLPWSSAVAASSLAPWVSNWAMG